MAGQESTTVASLIFLFLLSLVAKFIRLTMRRYYSLIPSPFFQKAIFSKMSRLGKGCDNLKNKGENNTIILRNGSNPKYGNKS
ncbi:hypothetical protein CBP27_13625 [Fischerella thermalis WC542]|uniref:Uncharacterized protein n=1 Tax=Fischerella thermalis JSC-11 TaxID=741277 RepID=G6FYJ2_9CYAN|nr:hypothetical protein FJSC11DRAFT_3941 [Fischerella thermalis JSC-11]PLZ04895.1 hypothetical protein CBP17_22015 [Fischerella thermalis WC114]PLZ08107.1 hypothetical protein CBP18_15360 [Fischerella thermalis WC119]PLZ17737.1 hypothetical protein CBP19_03430 [Fischerella thermalis WC1110]PLZ20556.1 hypothetical protein CBP30_11455 [Fischerella thermalis WC157]PLZ28777.1 hypothetical protein CBP28_11005 [Fischerella thermalis WC559]PLZ33984.1 hypothetical protein CBP10_06955 [Fischerella the